MTASSARIGLHYFPDTQHYREQDLQAWLPELQTLPVSWVVLIAPTERAIPEDFITGLLQSGIQPILHFPLQINPSRAKFDLTLLFESYARWGIRQVALFDRPNLHRAWPATAWSQSDPVEDFLDLFVPIAESACEVGLTPIFPPLEPGGDYWDLTFLQLALRGLKRRNLSNIIDKLGVGALAWTFDRPLDWGAGGPERWPETQPYFNPDGSQDHLGINISDWYQALCQSELGSTRPIFILRAGNRLPGSNDGQSAPDQKIPGKHEQLHAQHTLDILQLYSETKSSNDPRDRKGFSWSAISPHSIQGDTDIPIVPPPGEQVVCINFWLLSAPDGNPHAPCAWYSGDGQPRLVARKVKRWNSMLSNKNPLQSQTLSLGSHPIEHYLLLPLYAWGMAEWDLNAVQPFLQNHHPTIGFSVQEAALAAKVTIFGDAIHLQEEACQILLSAGCQVERLNQDGTLLAI